MPTVIARRRAHLLAVAATAVAGGLLAAGCVHPPRPPGHPGTTAPPTSAPASLAGTSWVLVPGSLGVPVPAGKSITAEFGADRVSGSSACNTYFAAVTVGPGSAIRFGSVGSTKMACEPVAMDAERAYLGRLGAVASYRLTGDTLELIVTTGMPNLRFRKAGPTAPAGPVGDWVVTGFVDGRTQAFVAPIAGSTITLGIKGDGSLGGRACNSYGGSWSVTGDRLVITDLFSTEMYCTSPEGVTEQETQYLTALRTATRWQVEAGTLTLASGEGRGRPLVTATPAP
jgi:heat shock protein HslJ